MSAARREAFLAEAGWGAARAEALAGDASGRRYVRLYARTGDAKAVLMEAPGRAEETRRFLWIAGHLRGLGLSAPACLAAEPEAGLALLEDLGDAGFARCAATGAAAEWELYAAAVDTLAALHRHPPPAGLPAPEPGEMAAAVAPFFEWYLPAAGRAVAGRATVEAALAEALARHAGGVRVLALRDCHADNLIWLPERSGAARVGLLDFQDAIAAHPAYDLVSLLADARRDLAAGHGPALMARYAGETGHDPAALGAAAAVLGVQRNLRILGIFVRLAKRDGRPGYLDHLSRLRAHLAGDLAHPALAGVRPHLAGALATETDLEAECRVPTR